MIHEYIANFYKRGQDEQARRALAAEITRTHTAEDEVPTYTPTDAQVDKAEKEYYASRRAHQYGPPEMQMEYITEHGITAWKAKVADIKAAIPKPGK